MEELPVEKINLIHRYLGPGLSEEENVKFESHLNEPDFREELLFRTEVLEAVSELRLDKAGKVIEEARLDHKLQADTTESKSSARFLVISIIIIFLIGIGIHFITSQSTETKSTQIFAEYYEAYPQQPVTRGAAVVTDADLEEAMNYYVAGDYEKASPSLNKINFDSDNIKLYQGISYLELNAFEKAENTFMSLVYSEDKNLVQQGEWYLALLYYKNGMVEQGDSTLTVIVNNPSHQFYAKANEILLKY